MLTTAVLAVLILCPIGAILLNTLGTKMLPYDGEPEKGNTLNTKDNENEIENVDPPNDPPLDPPVGQPVDPSNKTPIELLMETSAINLSSRQADLMADPLQSNIVHAEEPVVREENIQMSHS